MADDFSDDDDERYRRFGDEFCHENRLDIPAFDISFVREMNRSKKWCEMFVRSFPCVKGDHMIFN